MARNRDNRSSYKRLHAQFKRHNWWFSTAALRVLANIVDRKITAMDRKIKS